VTVILGRGDNSLLLWNNSNQSAPVASFTGHNDVVLDFTWRPKRNDAKDMELITWSRDQTLRVWRVDEETQKMCRESAAIEEGPFLDDLQSPLQKSSSSSKFAGGGEKSVVPALQHEFSLLNTNIPHIDVEQLDSTKRQANVRITANGHIISLQALFPANYPSPGCPPDFSYCQGTSLDENLSAQLMKVLKKVANHRVKKNRTCLEQCLREFVSALKKSTSHGDRGHIRVQSPRLEGALSGALHDACVPFPRTSGARFGHIGLLVTFSCPLSTKRLSLRTQSTPRALSVLSGGYLGNVMGTSHRDSNASFYLPDRVSCCKSLRRF
jgi:WD repeat-containing protein 59